MVYGSRRSRSRMLPRIGTRAVSRLLFARVEPELTVVVASHNRHLGVETLLGALRRQTLGPERFDVVLVDDGSTPPLTVNDDVLSVRTIRRESPGGPGAARNDGWRAARASLVAFTDDDCVPVPDWLEALLERGAGRDDVVVQGPVAPPPDQRAEVRPLSHTIEVAGPNRLFVTCNIAYSRALLERIEGFDESFLRSAEDADLGARATKAGAEIRFAERALVHHEVRQPSLPELLRHTTKWTYSVKAFRVHPELRDLLLARVFWKPTHPRLLLALAGLASRRPAVAALSALPYLAHYVQLYRDHPTAFAPALPKHLAVDLCELGTMVVGSVQYRTLVL